SQDELLKLLQADGFIKDNLSIDELKQKLRSLGVDVDHISNKDLLAALDQYLLLTQSSASILNALGKDGLLKALSSEELLNFLKSAALLNLQGLTIEEALKAISTAYLISTLGNLSIRDLLDFLHK